MAIIKAVNSKSSIATAINYITKKEKTEEKLISGIDCNPKTAIGGSPCEGTTRGKLKKNTSVSIVL